MEKERIVIIGAGLTGLNLARILQQEGKLVTILEARSRTGGRIYTKESFNKTKIEMGATWLGNQHENLLQLLKELKIEVFEQAMEGTSFFQPFSTSPPQPVELPPQTPNYRIRRGTSTIIEKLQDTLTECSILLNEPVQKISFDDPQVSITTSRQVYVADKVISTLPPALLAHSIDFQPSLPKAVLEVMKQTQTWMRDSIKAGVVFDQAFWKSRQLSGTLFSNSGPLNESYDHCAFDDSGFAMKGFINPAFSTLPPKDRKALVLEQLTSTFGPEVRKCKAYEELLWSNEKYTKGEDQSDLFPHQHNGHQIYQITHYQDRFIMAGAETSPYFGGYMEGAVRSSIQVAKQLISG